MIYLDNNSTTQIDAEVLESMMPYLTNNYGNASSANHSLGWVASDAVDNARKQVAQLINADEQEITFTAGATESLNMAIQGLCRVPKNLKKEIIVCVAEHSAVLETCNYLKELGFVVHYLPVGFDGIIDLNELKKLMNKSILFVAIMLANNETGTINDVQKIAEIVHEYEGIFMCDATQAIGKIDVDVQYLGIDILPISAHKINGPKGVGALYLRRKNPRVTIAPLQFGGGQENGLRPGTSNVASIVGLGKAAELAAKNLWNYGSHTSVLRTMLEQHFEYKFGVHINGSLKHRLPNTSNILFDNKKATELLSKMPLLAASTGSACGSAIAKPSHVLMAMGLTETQAYASIRFSLGKYTTQTDIENTVAMFVKAM